MDEPSADPPRFSVILATRDRPDDVARCLPTILANDYPAFEVIVVDQSATNATAAIVRGIDDARLSLIRLGYPGKSRAVNAGLQRARGTMLALTDDDVTVPPDWLRRGAAVLLKEPRPLILCGAFAPIEHEAGSEFVTAFLPTCYRRLRGIPVAPFQYIPFTDYVGSGANMMMWREDLERLGGCDEWLGPGSPLRSEQDTELVYRALRAGFTIVHDPTIIVLHYGRRQGRAVKDLLSGYSFGLGAFYTRNVRRGDWFAAYLLLQEFIWRAGQVTRAVLRRQRPPWLRYMAYMMLGAIAGLRHPTRLARPAPSAA